MTVQRFDTTVAAAPAAADLEPVLATPKNLVGALVRTARPRQWVKNALVLGAPFAAGTLLVPTTLGAAAAGTAAFTLAASSTYFLNDARDVEADRRHPVKRLRPVAAGVLSVRAALGAAVLCAVGGIAALRRGRDRAGSGGHPDPRRRRPRVPARDDRLQRRPQARPGARVAAGGRPHPRHARAGRPQARPGARVAAGGRRVRPARRWWGGRDGDHPVELVPAGRAVRLALPGAGHAGGRALGGRGPGPQRTGRPVGLPRGVDLPDPHHGSHRDRGLLRAVGAAVRRPGQLGPLLASSLVPFLAILTRYNLLVARGGGEQPEVEATTDRFLLGAAALWLAVVGAGLCLA